jgi:hypothetical protein
MATELSNQVSAALMLAANSTRSRGEAMVTQSARWSSEHIRQAGADAAKSVFERLEELTLQTERAARSASISACFCGVTAAVAAAVLVLFGSVSLL